MAYRMKRSKDPKKDGRATSSAFQKPIQNRPRMMNAFTGGGNEELRNMLNKNTPPPSHDATANLENMPYSKMYEFLASNGGSQDPNALNSFYDNLGKSLKAQKKAEQHEAKAEQLRKINNQ